MKQSFRCRPCRFAVIAALTLAWLFQASLVAQAQPMGAPEKIHSPAKACPVIPDPDALRSLAQDCAKDLASDGNCRAYAKDESEEYVIVRDCSANKPEAYLMMPVQPVTGIDDSRIFSAPLADLWEDAWLWSRKYPGQPAARTGLAINSKHARSQNQLHIHISCVLPQVRKALEAGNIPLWPARPVTRMLGPAGNDYAAVKVRALSGATSPFRIAQAMAGGVGDMKDRSIAVVGAQEADMYYVLVTTSKGAGTGHAEELLEQTCAPL
jgi:CDP-diacylglycerol pyrophosphatase